MAVYSGLMHRGYLWMVRTDLDLGIWLSVVILDLATRVKCSISGPKNRG